MRGVTDQKPLRPLTWRVRIGVLVLIWIAGWLVSVFAFYARHGFVPHGVSEMLIGPLLFAVVIWPASFAAAIGIVLQPLPVLSNAAGVVGAFAFWPSYILLLAVALTTGERKYFAALGALNIVAAVFWHIITWNVANG